MAKGKRKSDQAALQYVTDKLQRGLELSEEDRGTLRNIARLDLIAVVEQYFPALHLSTCAKNSVESIIRHLLGRPDPATVLQGSAAFRHGSNESETCIYRRDKPQSLTRPRFTIKHEQGAKRSRVGPHPDLAGMLQTSPSLILSLLGSESFLVMRSKWV